jgi:hypothetical protein
MFTCITCVHVDSATPPLVLLMHTGGNLLAYATMFYEVIDAECILFSESLSVLLELPQFPPSAEWLGQLWLFLFIISLR